MRIKRGRILKWELVQVHSAINFHLCLIYTAHFRIRVTCGDKGFESENDIDNSSYHGKYGVCFKI
jgi:hypothetical protein